MILFVCFKFLPEIILFQYCFREGLQAILNDHLAIGVAVEAGIYFYILSFFIFNSDFFL